MTNKPLPLFARREVLIGIGAVALAPWPTLAQQAWQKVKAYSVEFEVPAGWKRSESKRPPQDHDEVEFAENSKNSSAGAWFSIFPTNDELIDPDRAEQPTTIDGRAAKMTDMLTRGHSPPRRRQIVVYFSDPRAPAFLFDANSEQWNIWGPVLDRILASIKLPKR
ncbi:MAG: hypothetical protein PSV22_02020 [Pseudolabrys sp.]|nr:hypothetical protein [Pseudolabrys sp.]